MIITPAGQSCVSLSFTEDIAFELTTLSVTLDEDLVLVRPL